MKSILQTRKRCLLCAERSVLECHHVFEGSMRQRSEKYGLTVWLCKAHHTGDIHGNGVAVHFNTKLDGAIKRWAQKKAMKHYGWTREDFIEKIGRSYL